MNKEQHKPIVTTFYRPPVVNIPERIRDQRRINHSIYLGAGLVLLLVLFLAICGKA